MRDLSEQEQFWQGDFGDQYVGRNQGQPLTAANLALFAKALARTSRLNSLLELGTNTGNNLLALHQLFPNCVLQGVEINAQAQAYAQALGIGDVWHGSLFDYPRQRTFDLTLSKGVLIHLAPELLPAAYAQLHALSQRYILIGEYYNPVPVEVAYRGNAGKLFKRDFAGEMLDCYPDLQLLDYGFSYHRDPQFPTDDINWFLLEKRL
ncbi:MULTISPECIES: pseudaminic acid biosynthesis-associated methylase [unclassified Pseudomonas]|uniref:pseudaminic acid biosynthesis-associated methylase n=1 Tax=unclassified Pseudomonas TaxID=196821 RepID=UPI002AC8A506|nr:MULTISPECIES: pseudaminic acid biosynthesis-associated methylase [unclassified Pseudomonas]MEB0041410.1 pseudaminic acid biosynthesis-associated methylase [Pseudomonas sp. MH10]MEB0078686.1 pseudaminic acid biosynthesis-associated methylase [Pseudomonas sp. MH10out]MEB0093256.1 pseudaminic acid biosynthesis-associated methylase [Pseudomonas sp. CCI4.2]MEB0103776.1 pseudaminic acid biosynthesis-associated methylase [Pseudomonas sp. CCI3.2]MEB0121175.1 pseudaminic acid biosynthesis-associated